MTKNPPLQAGLLDLKLVLYLGRCNLSTLLIIRKHHGQTIPQGEVVPREVKPFTALVGPDCANARPDFFE